MFFNFFKRKIKKNIITKDLTNLLRKFLDNIDIDDINILIIRSVLLYSDDWPQDLKNKMESILVMDRLMR